MLYILPPPRAPNPPSPWDTILCTGAGAAGDPDGPTWGNLKTKRHPPRARLRNFVFNTDDSATGAQDEVDTGRTSKSLSECYFAGKGAALVLPAAEAQKSSRQSGAQGSIQKHLQSMFYLLRPEETLKMAVKLESVHPNRTRYLVVVSRMGRRAEESCLLGIDCNEKTTVGLVLRVLADTAITLDGDGGFSVSVCGRHHIFKPVSVQAMWSALQTLHKASSKAREENYFQGGLTHDWVDYYEQRIESDRSCLNEWHAMDDLESRRPPSPDSIRTKPRERDETEKVIKSTLKEIMMSVDLDEVTSKYIRNRLEEELDMDLGEYKSFIDQEMLTILGQMDAPTEIFDHVYLGSEWNASNYEELQKNGVRHILNVTREIDNFFPGTFDYLNIRVYDDEKTDLLKHWDNTFKYITRARKEGSKVLVHCKMGVSRSASVVIAYAMKAYNWDFKTAMQHVKEKRTCIKPNTSFLQQLETYEGILDAMKNKEKLQRSKSETNLKSPRSERVLAGSEPTPIVQALAGLQLQTSMSGQDLRQLGSRPKSWSPSSAVYEELFSETKLQVFLSLGNLNKPLNESLTPLPVKNSSARNVLMPCDNGESYSVSPNQIIHLPAQCQLSEAEQTAASVKDIVNELELQVDKKADRKKLVLNLCAQEDSSKPPSSEIDCNELSEEDAVSAQTKLTPPMLRAVLVKKEIWDPGENQPSKVSYCNGTTESDCDVKCSDQTMWTSQTILKTAPETFDSVVPSVDQVYVKTRTIRKDGDPFSNQLDRVFDREERKQQRISAVPPLPVNITETEEIPRECPSRQSSWSSYDSAVVLGYQGESREVPSRHSSWGSGDTRTLPSRNSSWGSYDMRPGAPIHYINEKGEKVLYPVDVFGSSSSGLFPYDKEDIPWHPGTVRRTKQKLEESGGKKTVEAKPEDDLLFISDNLENSYAQYKSPSSETLHSDYPTSVVSESDGMLEAFNTALIQSEEKQVSSAISTEIDIIKPCSLSTIGSRLSVSAPENSSMELIPQECSLSRSTSNVSSLGRVSRDPSSNVINTAQCFSVKQHKTFLENLYRDSASSFKKFDDEPNSTSGIVQSLKREFEAKTSTNVDRINQINVETEHKKGSSLPSSPLGLHAEKDKCDLSPTGSDPGEDLNFKKLIGKFEINSRDNQESVSFRLKAPNKQQYQNNKNARYSCFEVSVEKSPVRITQTPLISNYTKDTEKDGEFKRPPMPPVVKSMSPSVVMATVIAKATNKRQQQFGKSHPLARLNIKPRHNNPVYNTM